MRLRAAAIVCSLLAASLVGWGLTPPAARGQVVDTSVVDDHIEDVAESYQRLSGDPGAACSKACEDIIADVHRVPTAPEDPVVPRLVKSFLDKAKSVVHDPWGDLDGSFRFARGTAVGALLAANYYVWKVKVVGPIQAAYFVRAPKQPIDDGWQFVQTIADAGLYQSDGCCGTKPAPLPVGLVAYNNSTTTVMSSVIGAADPWCSGATWGPTMPTELEDYTWIWNSCVGSPMAAHGWKVPLNQVFKDSLDADATDLAPIYTPQGYKLTKGEAIQRLLDLFASGDIDYGTLKQWYCAVLGGECKNPKDLYPTTPECAGQTTATCTQRFRDAGFTGDITVQTLDADEAIMEQGAGLVTDTRPHANLEIAEPRDIIIYKNSDPLPAMTATDTSIANTLEAQNQDTVNGTNKKTIARTCRVRVLAAGRPTSDCTSLPLFIVGRDALVPARNDLAAIAANPSWVALNRRVDSGNTRWYRNQPGCLDSQRFPATAECDEYPYWSSMQAQNGTLNTMTPYIRWAPSAENGLEGRALKKFYSNDGPGVFPWSGCDIDARQLTDVLPTLASTYLVLPIPSSVAIRTTGVCNKP